MTIKKDWRLVTNKVRLQDLGENKRLTRKFFFVTQIGKHKEEKKRNQVRSINTTKEVISPYVFLKFFKSEMK